ncbi:type II toxin-antitoxin system RelE/ParE family toxin [Rhizobium sp. CG5]|uniref:type II toxin-antitoxin system RelE/ParE family toxin n=1 Tax=Rhizobium sp. CG5 TaxID=2726076 RepID=UPI002033F255|nr:type II toxin-antitoxin system RelE/ParE family toxin [Rhizobium sp. CG5]MCM2473533.1 type II toxin-antitoxin system RelE/ParE family toxin [Rhizobium sp. CG5]
MAFRIIRSEASILDLEVIFRHLISSYVTLGDDLGDAIQRATTRMQAVDRDMNSIARLPYQGTLFSAKRASGLRHITKNKVIFYFEVSEEQQAVRILAVFFGGQDHQRHILARLGSGH